MIHPSIIGCRTGGMRMVSHCPACDHTMVVRRLECLRCDTVVEGRFPFEFLALEPEEATFAKAFLLARGNLRELERTLGLSYATLRTRLDAVTQRLERAVTRVSGVDLANVSPRPVGNATPPLGSRAASPAVSGILEALEAGSIGVGEALERIRHARAT